MEEIEILSPGNYIETIDRSSVDELIEYKKKLQNYIIGIDNEIKKRLNDKEKAESLFFNRDKNERKKI